MDKNRILLKECQDDIKEVIKDYPEMKEVYNNYAKYLGCKITDLAWVLPDDEEDEEGWKLDSFFDTKNSKIKVNKVIDDEETNDFSVGHVEFIEVDGVKFVTEQNASPLVVYVNAKSFK